MTRENIINKIRKRMDEWTPFDDTPMLLGANEAMQPVGYQIEEVLDVCTDFILLNAPLRCVVSKSAMPAVLIVGRVATVELPDDFIRLNRIKFEDWKNYVSVFHEYNSKIAGTQRFPWIRGGCRKPEVILNEKAGKKILECYSTSTDLEEFVYVPSSHFDETDKTIMNDQAMDLLLSYVATTIYDRMNEAEFAKVAMQDYQITLQRILTQG